MARKPVAENTDPHHHPHAVRLLQEELPGQYPGKLVVDHGGLSPKAGEYFGLGVWDGKFVYDNLVGPAIGNWGHLSYSAFRARFASAVKKLNSMAGPDGKPSPVKASYIAVYSPNQRVSEKLADVRLNLTHMEKWMGKKWLRKANSKIGDFCLKPAVFIGPDAKFGHPEAPMSLDLYYKGHRLAGAGFLIFRKKGKVVMRIMNLQGTKFGHMPLEFQREYGERGMAKVFNEFESIVQHGRFDPFTKRKSAVRDVMTVALTWRSILVSHLINYAIDQGWQVEAGLPIRFSYQGIPAIVDEAYRRQRSSVLTAFKLAGFERKNREVYCLRIPKFSDAGRPARAKKVSRK